MLHNCCPCCGKMLSEEPAALEVLDLCVYFIPRLFVLFSWGVFFNFVLFVFFPLWRALVGSYFILT